jgi:hypothetical protein
MLGAGGAERQHSDVPSFPKLLTDGLKRGPALVPRARPLESDGSESVDA